MYISDARNEFFGYNPGRLRCDTWCEESRMVCGKLEKVAGICVYCTIRGTSIYSYIIGITYTYYTISYILLGFFNTAQVIFIWILMQILYMVLSFTMAQVVKVFESENENRTDFSVLLPKKRYNMNAVCE